MPKIPHRFQKSPTDSRNPPPNQIGGGFSESVGDFGSQKSPTDCPCFSALRGLELELELELELGLGLGLERELELELELRA